MIKDQTRKNYKNQVSKIKLINFFLKKKIQEIYLNNFCLFNSAISYFNAQNINSIISPRLSQFLSSTSSFSNIHYEERCTPLGYWGGRLGEFALIYFSMAFKNMKKVLPQFMGITGDNYDEIVERFNEECEERKTYMKT